MADGTRRGCFKFGCLGCLGIVAIFVGVVAVLAALALAASRREPEITRLDRVSAPPTSSARPTPQAGNSDAPSDDRAAEPIYSTVAEPGRIVLDVSHANFEIRRGEPGAAIRVEGSYDQARYRLEDGYESYGEAGWIYRLHLRRSGGFAWIPSDDAEGNRVRLILPPDLPITLSGKVGLGESVLELGGLWLLDVDLETGVGDHQLTFDDPLPVPLKRLQVAGALGELSLFSVGNASPETMHVRHSVGEVQVDLRGAWRRDAVIQVRCGVGECTVRVPEEGVELQLAEADVMIGEATSPTLEPSLDLPPGGRPVLRVSVSAKIGEVSIDRR